MTAKFVRDGKVAVLISPEHGAGWFTWNSHNEELLFDPTIVDMILNDFPYQKIEAYVNLKYPDIYTGGLDCLTVAWIPIGEKFRIHEYDGSESIVMYNNEQWVTA